MTTNYLYHVTVGDRKDKLSLADNDVSTLEDRIRHRFSIGADYELRMQVEDSDFPGEWVDLKADDELPNKAKLNVTVGNMLTPHELTHIGLSLCEPRIV